MFPGRLLGAMIPSAFQALVMLSVGKAANDSVKERGANSNFHLGVCSLTPSNPL